MVVIISKIQVQNIMKTYGNRPTNSIKKAGTVGGANSIDGLQMSEEGKLFQSAMNALKSVPDIREDKVAELKKAIKTNTYSVSSNEIAEKFIARSIVDELV